MIEYRVFETEQFQKDLRMLARAGQSGVVGKLREIVYPELARYPRWGPNVRKLKAYVPETWRYRIGPWRFFFEIDDEQHIVFMTAAAHRGSAY